MTFVSILINSETIKETFIYFTHLKIKYFCIIDFFYRKLSHKLIAKDEQLKRLKNMDSSQKE